MVWLAELFKEYGGSTMTMTINGFKVMVLFWQLGLVDTFSFLQFCINSEAQYTAIVAGMKGIIIDCSTTCH